MFVSGGQVSFLCVGYVRLELLAQVIEVDCKVLSPGRGNVMFGVDGDAGVKPVVAFRAFL